MLHEDELEIFRADIAVCGYTVAAIMADETGCDWAYSIGLDHSFGHPELVVVGMDAPLAGAIVEILSEEVTEGRRIAAGDRLRLEGGVELRANEVDDVWRRLGDWFNLGRAVMATWGRSWPRSLQLIWSDAQGQYPERPGDPVWTFRQPLLSAG